MAKKTFKAPATNTPLEVKVDVFDKRLVEYMSQVHVSDDRNTIIVLVECPNAGSDDESETDCDAYTIMYRRRLSGWTCVVDVWFAEGWEVQTALSREDEKYKRKYADTFLKDCYNLGVDRHSEIIETWEAIMERHDTLRDEKRDKSSAMFRKSLAKLVK